VGNTASIGAVRREEEAMAQFTQVFTTCDICNPSAATRDREGRGYFEGRRKEAKECAGYIKRKGKDICSECQDEEEESVAASNAG